MEFVSAGSDGKVAGWRAQRGGLQHSLLMDLLPGMCCMLNSNLQRSLQRPRRPRTTACWMCCRTAAAVSPLTRCCRGIHAHNPRLLQKLEGVYLVGTLEGVVFRCSTSHTSRPLQAYHGHSGAVAAVAWNPMHREVFVTASCDWTVAVWDAAISQVWTAVSLFTRQAVAHPACAAVAAGRHGLPSGRRGMAPLDAHRLCCSIRGWTGGLH